MDTVEAYATEFRNEIVPLSPYGTSFHEIPATGGWGSLLSINKLPRHADVLVEAFFQTNLPALLPDTVTHVFGDFDVFYTNHTAAAIFNSITCRIAGQVIDQFGAHYMDGLSELRPQHKFEAYEAIMKGNDQATMIAYSAVAREVWTHLPTAHSLFAGNGLPTVGMQHSDIEYVVQTNTQNTISCSSPPNTDAVYASQAPWLVNTPTFRLWVTLIWLHERERADLSTETLIYVYTHALGEVVQTVATVAAGATSQVDYELRWNHPVQSFFWTFNETARSLQGDLFNYQGAGSAAAPLDPLVSAQLWINGAQATSAHGPLYWRQIQPLLYANSIPSRHVYYYSFGRRGMDYTNPSGPMNMAFIDDARLRINWTGAAAGALTGTSGNGSLGAGTLRVFGIGWNAAEVRNQSYVLKFLS